MQSQQLKDRLLRPKEAAVMLGVARGEGRLQSRGAQAGSVGKAPAGFLFVTSTLFQ
jgi:hypothetical protein